MSGCERVICVSAWHCHLVGVDCRPLPMCSADNSMHLHPQVRSNDSTLAGNNDVENGSVVSHIRWAVLGSVFLGIKPHLLQASCMQQGTLITMVNRLHRACNLTTPSSLSLMFHVFIGTLNCHLYFCLAKGISTGPDKLSNQITLLFPFHGMSSFGTFLRHKLILFML